VEEKANPIYAAKAWREGLHQMLLKISIVTEKNAWTWFALLS
jgi:hypothetical protein